MLVLIYVPGVNRLFSMTSIAPEWLLVVPVGAAVFILVDLVRRTLTRASGEGSEDYQADSAVARVTVN